MSLNANGACRHTSQPSPIAAAAVIMTNKYDHRTIRTHRLSSAPRPTSERANLTAVILALEQAHTKARQLNSRAHMNITIHTDSKYVMSCMTQWRWKWIRNGFRTYRGREVANRDLIEKALLLEGMLLGAGTVEWVLISRSENEIAAAVVSRVLDEMEPGYEDSDSDAPIRSIWERGDC